VFCHQAARTRYADGYEQPKGGSSRRGHHSLWKDRALEQLPHRRLASENRSYEPVLEMITFAI
jgi:hypothetical protein